jgi:F-type H+-transporting ATPase subunit beta
MENKASPSNLGVVVSVRGSIVDIRFGEHLPSIYSVLRAGVEKQIVIEVLAQQDTRHVRGIALTPTQGLARGMAVEDTGGPLAAPVGKAVLSRMFDVFGNTIDREAALSDVEWRSVHRLGARHQRAGAGYRHVVHQLDAEPGFNRVRLSRSAHANRGTIHLGNRQND